MKLALITDPRGFNLVEQYKFAYHLVLAQRVLADSRYADFYRECSERGHFTMMDNGAAEEGTLGLTELARAATMIRADEIVLPDVLCDSQATINRSCQPDVLSYIKPKRRAVVPQGNTLDEWFYCANYFVENLDFATICIPKHAERFPGGRSGILTRIKKLGWPDQWYVHLLGIWDEPYRELQTLRQHFSWVRGIDTAAPFAWAQNKLEIGTTTDHISHRWGGKFDKTVAMENINTLWSWIWSYE